MSLCARQGSHVTLARQVAICVSSVPAGQGLKCDLKSHVCWHVAA